MNYLRKNIFLVIVLIVTLGFSQENNAFWDRTFWKSNPDITEIDKKIAEGNDVSALNPNAFDAVTYALLEKVDNKTIKYLLSKKGNGVNKLTHDGRTYIFWAAYRDNLEMMKYLVSKGARTDVIDSHGYSVINFAAVTGQLNTEIYDFCIANGADIKNEKNHDGANALLLIAPFLTDYELVTYFVDKGIDLLSTDDQGNGIFNYAAKKGNQKMMNLLIKKGVPYKNLNREGGNAMIFASQGTRGSSNTLEAYKYLESLGIKANVTTDKGITPLHALSYRNKDTSIFKYFLSKGVDINQPNEEGNTVFLNAAYLNNLEIVSLLAEHVTDINHKNKEGKTALMLAVSRNNLEVVNYLLDKGADLFAKDAEGNTLSYYLLNAFNAKRTKAFEEKLTALQEKGFKVAKKQSGGNTLYHLAAKKNDLALLKRVSAFNIPVNTVNQDGYTALHIAAMKSDNDNILKYLIAKGADKNIKTNFDESVYDLANENELLQKNEITLSFLK
ncbi:ankyrin repeat domain-containing protein [Flavobacteriaceae bacterium R38]|nr:ankyrin repeat domain-containing protein [Flavobacteriaceae bacterium R38]